ncbi:MAG: hypothetical protein R3325_11955, partial [Thermoanaerobaculia bacterium]|nr:hypothetical protein [Thermoanaerobaculia bacterium]
PRSRYRSPGADLLPEGAAGFPTVVASVPGPLGPASSLFTLTQIELRPDAGEAVLERVVELTRRRLAFQRTALLREVLRGMGSQWEELVWEAVEPGAAPWAGPGLVRVGARVVLAHRDLGTPGVLDEGDLVLDFDRGARLLRLGDVFQGEGLVERARGPAAAGDPTGGGR